MKRKSGQVGVAAGEKLDFSSWSAPHRSAEMRAVVDGRGVARQARDRTQSQVSLVVCTWEIGGDCCERELAHSLGRTKKCSEVTRHPRGADPASVKPQDQ